MTNTTTKNIANGHLSQTNGGSNALPPQNPNAKCIVLVPTQDMIEGGCEEGLHELEKMGYTVLRRWGCSDISMARSQMAADALGKGFEELMWIDSDILFDPNDVNVLRSHNLPIIGGYTQKKGTAALPASFARDKRKLHSVSKVGLCGWNLWRLDFF